MSNKMSKKDSARIQAVKAKKNKGLIEKESFEARAQSAADKNNTQILNNWPSKKTNIPSGSRRSNNPPKKTN